MVRASVYLLGRIGAGQVKARHVEPDHAAASWST